MFGGDNRGPSPCPLSQRARCLVLVLALALAPLTLVAAPAAAQEGTGPAPEAAEATESTPAPPEADPDAVPSADELMRYLNDLWRSSASYARMRMTVVTENWSRELDLESWSRGADEALVIIRAPAREAGTATLRTSEGLWNYAPRADRLMRIPSGLLSESWMGSHFTNEDLMRESDWNDDFDTELSWVERDGQRLLLARSIPRPEAAIVWTRIDYYITPDWLPLEAEYFDGEELLRTMRFGEVREVVGRPIPMRFDIIPHDKPGERTTVEYQQLELDADVDPSLFTQRGLRRAAQR
jgi:hypothetical protein